MTGRNGAVRIFLYNWPIYVGTWISALVLFVLPLESARLTSIAALAGGAAVAWSLVSLGVSSFIYDRSELVAGRWVPPLLGPKTTAWATIHAGLDAEIDLDAVMQGRCVARLDIFDRATMTSPSIARARARTPPGKGASPCDPTALLLENDACDAIVVAFTAHEIRDRGTREAFFRELRRSLRPGGKLLLVEHLRDFANFLAFGPGYLHFVSRREWLRLAQQAELAIASEARITPFVMALTVEKPL